MDTNTTILIGSMVIANIGTAILLFTWATSHADKQNQDVRNLVENVRDLVDSNAKETRLLIQSMAQEMKDFHGRLCTIEERRNK